MTKTRLVLLEGPVGAGKSTTGELLAGRLNAAGSPARYLFGFDPAHPIRTRCEGLARLAFSGQPYAPPELDAADDQLFTSPQWARLAAELATGDEVLVVEGKYFQQCLEYPRLLGASDEQLFALQRDIVAAMAPASPRVIYLGVSDRTGHRAAVVAERPDGWPTALGGFFAAHPWGRAAGVEGAAAFDRFYDEWAPVEAELVRRHDGPTLELVDAHLDRAAAWDAITGFLA